MKPETIALRAAEAVRDAAAALAAGDSETLRRQGHHHTADAYQYVARRIRALDLHKLVDQASGVQANPDELAAFDAAATGASFNVQRRDSGELFHPIAQRVHQVWRAAVAWAREQVGQQAGAAGASEVCALPDGIKPVDGIPAAAMRAANALLADMIGKREWDVPCAAKHIMAYCDTGVAGAGESIDTPEFREKVAGVAGWARVPISAAEVSTHWNALVAHIDAQLARQRQGEGEPVAEVASAEPGNVTGVRWLVPKSSTPAVGTKLYTTPSAQAQGEPVLYVRDCDISESNLKQAVASGHGITTSANLDGDWSIPLYRSAAQADEVRDAWQPIATAPHNKLLLLAYEFDGPGDWRIKVGGYWDGGWEVFGASWTPTRWMPLPSAPKVSDRALRTTAADNQEG